MRSNYKRLGDYIRLVDKRNVDLSVELLVGLTINKIFISSVANIIGSDMANYKIIRKNQFACSLMQVRRDKRIPVALYAQNDPAIISQAYPVFEISDINILQPEYLMMWFSRSEFDREACFYAVGGVRGSLEWEDFCNMRLPIPCIEKQREIIAEYNVVEHRIKLNEQLINKLEETAQAIYKQWFVDFEFPDENGKPYKSNGGEMVESELGEIPKGWEKCILKEISNCLDYKRRPLSEEERNEFKGKFPYFGAMGIVDYVKEYIFDGEYLLFSEDGVNVIDEKGHPAVFLIWGKFWVNNHAHILVGKEGFSTRLIYSMLKDVNVSDLVTGAAQPKINQENMNSIKLIKPNISITTAFDEIINPMFEIIKNKIIENQKLSELKDLLLSKLAIKEK